MIRRLLFDVFRDTRGAAAVEMAIVTPLLLTIMMGSAELGNYLWNEHTLLKAVRDGARFAARQSFSNYPDCSTVSTTMRDDTRNVVIYGYLSDTSGGVLTPNIAAANVTVGTSCPTISGTTLLGLYKNQTNGPQVVTVSASVSYKPILSSAFGFSGLSTQLNATSQAAVTGL